jgi:hypothetical protein
MFKYELSFDEIYDIICVDFLVVYMNGCKDSLNTPSTCGEKATLLRYMFIVSLYPSNPLLKFFSWVCLAF